MVKKVPDRTEQFMVLVRGERDKVQVNELKLLPTICSYRLGYLLPCLVTQPQVHKSGNFQKKITKVYAISGNF